MKESEQDMVFKQFEEGGLDDIDSQFDKKKRKQAVLKQYFAEEMQKEGKDTPEYERVQAEYAERQEREVTDSIDGLPVKQKRKWRIW